MRRGPYSSRIGTLPPTQLPLRPGASGGPSAHIRRSRVLRLRRCGNGQDVRAGRSLGTIVSGGQREDGWRPVAVANTARKLERQGGAVRERAQMVLKRKLLSVDTNDYAATARLRVEGEIAEACFHAVGGAERSLLDAGNRAAPPLGDGDMCGLTVSWAVLKEPNDPHGHVGVRGTDARGSRIGALLSIWPMTLLGGRVPDSDPELMFINHELAFRRDFALDYKLSPPDTFGAATCPVAVLGGCENCKRDTDPGKQNVWRGHERLSAAPPGHRVVERLSVGSTLAGSPESLCTVKEVGEG